MHLLSRLATAGFTLIALVASAGSLAPAAASSDQGASHTASLAADDRVNNFHDASGLVSPESEEEADVWVTYDSAGEPVVNVRTSSRTTSSNAKRHATEQGVALIVHNASAFSPGAVNAIEAPGFDSALKAMPEVVGVEVDVENMELDVDVSYTSAASTSLSSTRANLSKALPEYKISVNVIDGFVGDTDTIRGGGAMGNCTLAFTASAGGRNGFLGAAHCYQTTLTYWDTPTASGSASGTATHRTSYNRRYADVAFYSLTGNSITNQFWTTSGGNAVTTGSSRTVSAGQFAQSYGKVSGNRSGQVQSTSYKPTWSGACGSNSCYATFVNTNAGVNPGDSGGPVWTETNRPLGVIKGGSSTSQVYSKISYGESIATILR